MDCNKKTKRQWAWESGYYAFVRERGQILDKIAAGQAKEEEKNLFVWPSTSAMGKKSTQAAAKHVNGNGQK